MFIKQRYAVALGISAALALAVLLTSLGTRDTVTDTEQSNATKVEKVAFGNQPYISEGHTQSATVLDQQLPYNSAHGALVRSLKGIYFDRDLAVDEYGNLRISSDLKDIFDFFFSAIEEEDLDIVLARIDEYLRFKLQEPALSQALTSLSDYVKYKASLVELELEFSERIASFSADNNFSSLTGEYLQLVKERMEEVKHLRSDHLSTELHQAFYADKELYDDYMLRKLTIGADKALTDAQRNAALEILDNEMPAEFIAQRASANPVAAVRQATDKLTQSSSSPQEIYTARARLVGEPAAARLGSLDAQRAAWDVRYTDYETQRDSINNNDAFTVDIKAHELDLLRDRLFTQSERVC